MGTPASPPRRPNRELALFLAGVILVAAVSLGVVVLGPLGTRTSVLASAGTNLVLAPFSSGFGLLLNYSWGWGAYLKGSWVATVDTAVTVVPALQCYHCPLFQIYGVHGLAGTLNYTFGGLGREYPNMTIGFGSSAPDIVHVTEAIEVVYPPMTVLYPAGTTLSGTGLVLASFTVRIPGAFLVGSWKAVNTTMWAYNGTPADLTNCAGWPIDSPPIAYQDSLNQFLTPGTYSVGSAQCSTRPWTITITATIGYFSSG